MEYRHGVLHATFRVGLFWMWDLALKPPFVSRPQDLLNKPPTMDWCRARVPVVCRCDAEPLNVRTFRYNRFLWGEPGEGGERCEDFRLCIQRLHRLDKAYTRLSIASTTAPIMNSPRIRASSTSMDMLVVPQIR